MYHRVLGIAPIRESQSGDKVLIIGASGGCGTAFLQPGRLANFKMYGIASKSKHPILAEYGATPIDYRTEDFVEVIRRAEPGGLDASSTAWAGTTSNGPSRCCVGEACSWGTAIL